MKQKKKRKRQDNQIGKEKNGNNEQNVQKERKDKKIKKWQQTKKKKTQFNSRKARVEDCDNTSYQHSKPLALRLTSLLLLIKLVVPRTIKPL